jgi:predicted RNA-binding Zn-ribbon protein involved in translation (DUF1610 family)
MEIKLPYGLKNNELVSIEGVEKGLACDCICPNCKAKLIARHGDTREHHFAHYKVDDCGWRGESIIHKISKDIIARFKYFKVPILYWSYKPEVIIYGETTIPVDNVRLEKKIDNIIPDIVIESKGRELIVEIKVSHGIDYNKYLKIKKLNIPTIEIDAREVVSSLFSEKNYFLKSDEFEDTIVNGIKNKYWIYNTEKERLKNIFKNNYAERFTIETLKSENSQFSDLIYIDYCPIIKRTWNSGFKKGESYAKLQEDCRNCNYYLGEDMREIRGAKTGILIENKMAIYCIGHLSSKTDYEIDGIIFRNKKKINYDKNESTKHNPR